MFVSTDGGATWSDRSAPSMDYWTTDVVIDPSDPTQNTWYACVYSGWGGAANNLGGLYRTTDAGLLWTQISTEYRVGSITVDPSDPSEAFMTTETDGLWYTSSLQSSSPTFTQVAGYPFMHPERVYYNPYNPSQIWVTSFGSGVMVGSTQTAPTLTWPQPANVSYGTALSTTQLDATASVPGQFVYSPAIGTVLNAGAGQTLSVTFTPTDTVDYSTVTFTTKITVVPAPLTVTAQSVSMTYGATVPALTDTITGFVNGDTASVVSGSAALSTTAESSSPVGTYPISVTLGTLSAANYTFTNLAAGLLTVDKTHLTVTANNIPRFFDTPNPTFTVSLSGFVNGDTPSVVTGSPGLSTTATLLSPAGPYPITVTTGTLSAANYDFANLVNGTLTITPASTVIVTISPSLLAPTYGQALSFTATVASSPGAPIPQGSVHFEIDGKDLGVPETLVNGVATSLSVSTLGAGTHQILALYTAVNSSSVTGTVTETVAKAHLAIVPTNLKKYTNTSNPTLTWHYTGFVNGDTAITAQITGMPALATTATTKSPIGSYPISVSSAGTLTASNYDFPIASFGAGTLTVSTEPPLNFDGTGKSEMAVFRPSTAQWYVDGPNGPHQISSTKGFGATNLGDIPVPGDYDGVGYTEMAVYRPSTGQWFVDGPNGPHIISPPGGFGGPVVNDIPVPGDYDGVGHTEMAVFVLSTAQWIVYGPNGPHTISPPGGFGAPSLGDIPVPGDYDGVGHTEMAVFRPSTAQWFVYGQNGGHEIGPANGFGAPNLEDIPVPGDYDGVGHTEPAVFRPSTAQWYVDGPNGPHKISPTSGFGATNLFDIPLEGEAAVLEILGKIGGPHIEAIATSLIPVALPVPTQSPSTVPALPVVTPGSPVLNSKATASVHGRVHSRRELMVGSPHHSRTAWLVALDELTTTSGRSQRL